MVHLLLTLSQLFCSCPGSLSRQEQFLLESVGKAAIFCCFLNLFQWHLYTPPLLFFYVGNQMEQKFKLSLVIYVSRQCKSNISFHLFQHNTQGIASIVYCINCIILAGSTFTQSQIESLFPICISNRMP